MRMFHTLFQVEHSFFAASHDIRSRSRKRLGKAPLSAGIHLDLSVWCMILPKDLEWWHMSYFFFGDFAFSILTVGLLSPMSQCLIRPLFDISWLSYPNDFDRWKNPKWPYPPVDIEGVTGFLMDSIFVLYNRPLVGEVRQMRRIIKFSLPWRSLPSSVSCPLARMHRSWLEQN